MHEAGICHLDIKPKNFLYRTKGGKLEVALTDFGLSLPLGTAINKYRGSDLFSAPEIMDLGEGGMGQISIRPSADMYSLGLVLYEMAHGLAHTLRAITGKSSDQKIKHIRQTVKTIRDGLNQKSELDQLIYALLDPTASARPSIDLVLDTLQRTSVKEEFAKVQAGLVAKSGPRKK